VRVFSVDDAEGAVEREPERPWSPGNASIGMGNRYREAKKSSRNIDTHFLKTFPGKTTEKFM